MTDLLFTLLSFLVALSVLIAVHEFGHFWVARKLGVKVLRFSIGFGNPLWTRRGADGTEYVIAGIPLGGYVKMLDEREGEVAPEELGRAFNRQPVGRRFAIAAAGPLFNFAFAIAAYWLVFVMGVPGLKPLVGETAPGSVADIAGVRGGEELLAVGDELTPTWRAAIEELIPYAVRKESVAVRVEAGGVTRELTFDFSRLSGELEPEALPEIIGMQPFQPRLEPVIGDILPDSAAAAAGIRPGDRILAIDGEPIATWKQMTERVRAAPGRPLRFEIGRDGGRLTLEVRPLQVEERGKHIGRLGASSPELPEAERERLIGELRHGPVAAIGAAFTKTWETSKFTVWAFKEMLLGRMSIKNISGPVSIAVYAKASAADGLAQFLAFLGLVSVSLAVLNLLPVPVLDGGHLLFYAIEFIKGSPVSEQVETVGQKVGIALIMALMTIALYNDLARWVG